MEALIIGCFIFIFYTYFGYPFFLWLWARRRSVPAYDPAFTPTATVVIAAFNEEGCLGETLSSILASDYPAEALDVIVVSDASTDQTDAVAASFSSARVQLLRQEQRSGQTAGLITGARAAQGDIVIFADASGIFQPVTVRNLIRHFIDPRVGAVSGHNGIRETQTAVSKGDGAYSRYDRTLRALESRTGGSWVGCQGGLFAIRKPLFRVAFPLDIAADNATCYQLYEQGYIHRFDPAAQVSETPPQDLQNEFRRKVRIIVLQLHGIRFFKRLFNPWKHPSFFFQNVSHKIFRWLVPFALVAMAVASAASSRPWAHAFFILQCLFYFLAVVGFLLGKGNAPKVFSIPAYFVTVNLAGLLAWAALFRDYTIWTPPAREEESH